MMYTRQNLYKATNVPKSLKSRRDILKENRFNRRQDDFQQRRNISLSPETIDTKAQKINGIIAPIKKTLENDSVLRKQREYLSRFVEWKKQKREMNKENINKTRPFIPAGSGSSNNLLCQIEKHKPIKVETAKTRRSIYALKKPSDIGSANLNQPKVKIPSNSKNISKKSVSVETATTKKANKLCYRSNVGDKERQSTKNQKDDKPKNHFVEIKRSPLKTISRPQAESKIVSTQCKKIFKCSTTKEENKNLKVQLGKNMKVGKVINNKTSKSNLLKIPKAELKCIANQTISTSEDAKSKSSGICVTSTRFKSSNTNVISFNNRRLGERVADTKVEQKFNFIRYSLAFSKQNEENALLEKLNKNNDLDKSVLNNNRQEAVNDKVSTPAKTDTEKPFIYLSPFVSVTRGKNSRKKEERQCNNTDSNALDKKLSGIRFYRQQLEKETEYLQSLCEIWEKYKRDHQTVLEERCGDDMINATLGQTKLLISKKFKQFSQLIDRCEKNIYSLGLNSGMPIEDDGSENTKPITLTDLEGFWWSMIKLQLDNLEKRFENLNRWKTNDWEDPDEVIQSEQTTVAISKNISKVNKMKCNKIKKTAKSASSAAAFIAMMRKNQAKKLQQLPQDFNDDDAVILISSRSSNRKNTSPSKQQSAIDKHPMQKFNFLRYSLGEQDMNTQNNEEETEENNALEKPEGNNDLDKSILSNNRQEAVNDKVSTPTKTNAEKPFIYLSPFVSVTRGKSSRKKEERQCNNTDSNVLDKNLSGIRYYRQQLEKETEYLQSLCEIWEQYKRDNQTLLVERCGDDMINATLGQTKLLISKKFKQFSQLIDRCEKNIYSLSLNSGMPIEDDGSENTKPITLTDLEGFWWSMIKLQLDNLEKRFENLNRWKTNDWKDPDEVIQPEQTTVTNFKNISKVKKMKCNKIKKAAKSASSAAAFIAMMRKNQAQKREQQQQYTNDNCDIILMASPKQQQERLQERHTVVVRDRKFMSPSATRLSLLGPKVFPRRSSSLMKQVMSQQDALCLSSSTEKLHKSFEVLNTQKRLPKNNISSNMNGLAITPPPSARKSILKTPGTAKSKLKNVLFDDKLRVRAIDFIINDDVDSVNNSSKHNEDTGNCLREEQTEQVYTLRNRKVPLRPSSEIVIPTQK